jgi:hypothetical protein
VKTLEIDCANWRELLDEITRSADTADEAAWLARSALQVRERFFQVLRLCFRSFRELESLTMNMPEMSWRAANGSKVDETGWVIEKLNYTTNVLATVAGLDTDPYQVWSWNAGRGSRLRWIE